jgi:hypothetical protein
MGRTIPALVVLVLFIALLFIALLGWRRRQARQSSLPHPESPPADLGAILGVFAGLYAATTIANEPLNRIAVRGLGYRAKTTLTVAAAGIVLPIAGQRDILIPAGSIHTLTRATWVIDKAVEPDGLSLVGWSLGGTAVDSYFRLDEPEDFERTVKTLLIGKKRSDATT